MYDVHSKWAELVKERGNLPHEVQKRFSNSDRKSKGSSRSQVLNSPPESSTSSTATAMSQANLATSMASTLSFPSLASAGLGNLSTTGLAPGLLSGLTLGNFDSKNPLFDVKNNPLFDPKNNPFLDPKNHPLFDPKNLSFLDPKNNALFDPKNHPFFDPKNNSFFDAKNNPLLDPKNPLLLPFGGLPNMGALGGMGHLSSSMNFFANLASMGLPTLSGLETNASGANAVLPTDQASPGSSSNKGKSRKAAADSERHSSSKTSPVSSSSTSSTTSLPNNVAGGLPFYFPNPSMLYSPLGLGGLNPFSLPPAALSSAYDNLAQQCGLLNGGLTAAASTSGTTTTRGSSSSRSQGSGNSKQSTSTSSSPSSSHRHHRSGRDSMDRHNLQHLLLPHDAHLLESLGRTGETNIRNSERRNKESTDRKELSDRSEKRSKDNDSLSKSFLADFPASSSKTEERQSRRSSKVDHDKKESISTQSLLMSSLSELDDRMLKRLREPDMKEALEVLSRSHAEFFTKSMPEASIKSGEAKDFSHVNMADLISRTIEEHNVKRPKESLMKEVLALSGTSMTEVKAMGDADGKKYSSLLFSDVPDSGEKITESANEIVVKRRKDKSSKRVAAAVKLSEESVQMKDAVSEKSTLSEQEVNVSSKDNVKLINDEERGMSESDHKMMTKNVDNLGNRSSVDYSEKSDESIDQELGSASSEPTTSDSAETSSKNLGRGRRGRSLKKSKSTKSDPDEHQVVQPIVERKNLRSSAGRAARAAAERAALKDSSVTRGGAVQQSEKSESEDEQKLNDNRED